MVSSLPRATTSRSHRQTHQLKVPLRTLQTVLQIETGWQPLTIFPTNCNVFRRAQQHRNTTFVFVFVDVLETKQCVFLQFVCGCGGGGVCSLVKFFPGENVRTLHGLDPLCLWTVFCFVRVSWRHNKQSCRTLSPLHVKHGRQPCTPRGSELAIRVHGIHQWHGCCAGLQNNGVILSVERWVLS